MRAVAPQRRLRVGKGLGERGRDVGKWVGGHFLPPAQFSSLEVTIDNGVNCGLREVPVLRLPSPGMPKMKGLR